MTFAIFKKNVLEYLNGWKFVRGQLGLSNLVLLKQRWKNNQAFIFYLSNLDLQFVEILLFSKILDIKILLKIFLIVKIDMDFLYQNIFSDVRSTSCNSFGCKNKGACLTTLLQTIYEDSLIFRYLKNYFIKLIFLWNLLNKIF